MSQNLDHVDYFQLDKAKNAFIQAGKRTVRFAKDFGFMPEDGFGASANVFNLNLKPFLQSGQENLHITLLPEGLGTADDARPEDLSGDELVEFWHNIGTKTISCLTNDAASSGMQTILLSLYLPSADPTLVFSDEFMKGFLDGIVDGCKLVGCVYFSGETPQLKNKIVSNKLDIAGALFGIMPPGIPPIDGSIISAGDHIVFVESSGPHENGFTSLRELADRLPDRYRTKLPSGQEYWQAINAPSKLYTPLVQSILSSGITPTNIEPISGHGWQKLLRSAKPLKYVITDMLPVPEVFSFVSKQSKTPPKEMIKIFNYGLGLAIYTKTKNDANKVVELASGKNLKAIVAGHIEESSKREVVVQPLNTSFGDEGIHIKQG
jgi:phosphoribosylformylglycinamidine cyclo-ligase